MTGSIAVGVAAGLVLRWTGYPLVGEAVYWAGILGFLAVWRGTSVQLVDERDVELERRAAHTTLSAVGPLLVLGASTARVLTWVTDYTVPIVIWGVLYGYVSLFVVFGVAYVWHRYRS